MIEKRTKYNEIYSLANINSFNIEINEDGEEGNWIDSSLQYLNNDLVNEEISKDFISKKRKNIDYKNISEIKDKNKNESEPIPYLLDNILEIFKNNFNENQYKFINKSINFKKAYPKDLYLSMDRKIMCYEDFLNELIEKKKRTFSYNNSEGSPKRGRKTGNKNIGDYHDKMSSDNIIKKIKAKLFEYAIKFLNNLLNKIVSPNKYILFKLDYYKYINRLKKDRDLSFLNMTLKKLFSGKVSLKYLKTVGIIREEENKENEEIKNFQNHNCECIKNIFKNDADDTILFVFNMTFRDWIDIFTLKKTINEISNKYKHMNYKNIKLQEIAECLIGVDKLLEGIMNKNQSGDYLTLFILYLYNYERWFYKKKSRIKKNRIDINLKEN